MSHRCIRKCVSVKEDSMTEAAMAHCVTVVSGLPRSGTSMMMRMLVAGGLQAIIDGHRPADDNNPHGYFEYEPAKRLASEAEWIETARGKVVKVIHALLYDLPRNVPYRIVLMERDLGEVLASQSTMLDRLGTPSGSLGQARLSTAIATLQMEYEKARTWLFAQPNIRFIEVRYAEVLAAPIIESRRVARFLGGHLDARAMASAVDLSLYRSRSLTVKV